MATQVRNIKAMEQTGGSNKPNCQGDSAEKRLCNRGQRLGLKGYAEQYIQNEKQT